MQPGGIRGRGTAAHRVFSWCTAVAELWRGPGAQSTGRSLGQSTCRAVPQLAADLEAAARLDLRSCLQGGLIGQMRAVPYMYTP